MRSSISSPALSSDAALEVRGLTGPAGGPVIHNIALRVNACETVLVLGPIQSGKSMLMRHLLGLETAESGQITVDGLVFDACRPLDAALLELRTRVGVIFEGSALLRRITVTENVELPLLEHSEVTTAEAREAARELLAEVGMQVNSGTMPAELDRAQQRRVALARAIALRPCLLLLDEPTLGLDSHAAHEFDQVFEAVQDRYGFGGLIFSHEVRHAFGPVKEIDIMIEGRIVARGPRDELLESEDPFVRRLLHRRERE
jgi:phospholipid/cholesterol/gamma-HCH transport system ATP-binding protein